MPVHHSFLADFMAWILILFNNSHASIAHSKNFSSWHFTMTGYPIRLNKGKTTIQGLGYFFWGGGVSTLWKKRWPRRLWEKLVIIPLWPRSGMPPRSAQRRARVCRRRIEKLGSLRSRRICDSLHLGNGCLPEKSQRSWRQPRLSTGCHEPFFFLKITCQSASFHMQDDGDTDFQKALEESKKRFETKKRQEPADCSKATRPDSTFFHTGQGASQKDDEFRYLVRTSFACLVRTQT